MNGWDESAKAWIADMGTDGDWSRKHVLDPFLDPYFDSLPRGRVLDLGSGEGRYCRKLTNMGFDVVGLDPTQLLVERSKEVQPDLEAIRGDAEALPFQSESFDLVLSCLSLIDIDDFRAAITESSRVLKPGGLFVVANLNDFATSVANPWIKDAEGNRLHLAVDNYMTEQAQWVGWRGINICNWHRPVSAYMKSFLDAGLQLKIYDQPPAVGVSEESAASYARAPYFVVMVWQRS
ncbi:MAG: class I SAM-dependent methyltransferase [Fimbriimonadaceae bacterium]